MSRVSDRQLVEFINRRNLPPTDPLHISNEMVKNFFDGRLVLADEGAQVSTSSAGRIMETGALVERLIKAGYHKVTDSGKGMKASAYRNLWPRTVTQPPEYAGRFDEILLVDATIKFSELVRLGNFVTYVQPEACQDIVPAPLGQDGKPAVRYIAFVQLGKKNLNRTVADCRASFAPDEVGLITREGLHLPIQHEPYLRQYAADLPGSAYDETRAPYVYWVGAARPSFSAYDIRVCHPSFGSASRGSEIIALS